MIQHSLKVSKLQGPPRSAAVKREHTFEGKVLVVLAFAKLLYFGIAAHLYTPQHHIR